MIDKRKMGKRSRAQGKAFELRVRKDLEEKGWIVDRWNNNVSDFPDDNIKLPSELREDRKLVPAKAKFNPFTKMLMMGSGGFPDFIAYKCFDKKRLCVEGEPEDHEVYKGVYGVIGVECKMRGILDKQEKEKCRWLLANHIFSKVLIASKTKVKNKIVIEYKEFKE